MAVDIEAEARAVAGEVAADRDGLAGIAAGDDAGRAAHIRARPI